MVSNPRFRSSGPVFHTVPFGICHHLMYVGFICLYISIKTGISRDKYSAQYAHAEGNSTADGYAAHSEGSGA
ncbi:hypothetical protein SAMN05518856_10995 [Paenibacillus sp. OK003]|nr:hypothetical protein SAMN05518856_10995 [Paenibacillus sp. OK003]